MNPLTALIGDRERAFAAEDPMAKTCTLALADQFGQASARTLVLRGISDRGLVIFINKSSPKWRVLSAGGHYEILLWYPSIQCQYRIQGQAVELTDGEVLQSWHMRPEPGKRLDFLYHEYPQSSSILDRDLLIDAVMSRQTLVDEGQPPPAGITAFELAATIIERLDLSPDLEVHDRRLFTLVDGHWQNQVLVP